MRSKMSSRKPFDYKQDKPIYEWQVKVTQRQNEIDELLHELRLIGTAEANDVANRLELIRIKPKGWQQKKYAQARLAIMGKGYMIIGRVARKAKDAIKQEVDEAEDD